MNRFISLSRFTTAKPYRNTFCYTQPVVRYFSSATDSSAAMQSSMNRIEELFSAAKDELEYAEESQGSIYYHEDHATAENAVSECLEAYDTFLKDLPSDDMRNEVQSKVGMKIKELKMAFDSLSPEGSDH
ncbi:hypothetical protein K501DRAFT_244405 [Backusella circina FSU 941]|nr:hypothetical protein K501DRAFT_244405 [Backusella circina FSU 941]